jgi:hypothetical protein
LKRDMKRMKREHEEQLRAASEKQSSQSDDEGNRVAELWSNVMQVSSDRDNRFTCLYKNVHQTRALMFELTTGLKDDNMQYRPVFTDEELIEDIEQVKRDALPDYLRNDIYFKRETLSVFMSKVISFLNSRAATESSDSE